MTILDTSDGLPGANFSTFRIVSASYVFLLSHAILIVRAVWVPLAMAALVLVVTFKIYFSMLALYVAEPSVRIASLTVGLAIALLFVWQFLFAVASARLAGLVFRSASGDGGRSANGNGAVAARLYAAILRFVFIVLIALAADVGVVKLARLVTPAAWAQALTAVRFLLAAAILVILPVRCGFLLPALAVNERRQMLRRAWRISQRQSGRLLVLWLALGVMPFVLLQSLGEFAIGPMLPVYGGAHDFLRVARAIAANDMAIVTIGLTLAVSSSVALVLTTIGSCLAYDALKSPG